MSSKTIFLKDFHPFICITSSKGRNFASSKETKAGRSLGNNDNLALKFYSYGYIGISVKESSVRLVLLVK